MERGSKNIKHTGQGMETPKEHQHGYCYQAVIQEQEDLTKAMGEATSQRDVEKINNEAIISEAHAGSGAVESTLGILEDPSTASLSSIRFQR